jgi:hypothetical protein
MLAIPVAIRMDDTTHRAAKIAAAHEGISLGRLYTEAVAEWLIRHGHPTEVPRPGTRPTP